MNTINALDQRLAEYKAKRKTKLTAGTIGWTLFTAELIVTFLSTVISIAFAFSDKGIAMLSDSVFLLFLNVALTLVLFIIAPLISSRALNYKFRSIMPLHRVEFKMFLGCVLLGFGFNSISNVLSSFFSNLVSMFGVNPGGADIETPNGFGGFLFSIICIAAVPALIEEFAFRGFALGICRRIMPDSAAIFVSAFLFGIIHGNFSQIPFALCMGLVMGYITVISNSVWPAIIVHFLNNAISVVLDYSMKNMGPLSSGVVSCFYLIITAILLIFGLIMLRSKLNTVKFNEIKNEIAATKYIKWAILNPGVICFTAFVFSEMFLVELTSQLLS